jgi:hypothetical protein
MMIADYAFWFAVAFMAGCNLYFGPRIKSRRIAMQWGTDGEPTWYARKALGLWGMVAFALAVRLLIWAASTYTPEMWCTALTSSCCRLQWPLLSRMSSR